MSTTLWDTTGREIMSALASERRQGGTVATGHALTLVIVVEERQVPEAEQAATIAAQSHPCRLLIVVRRQIDTADRLDAEVSVGGRLGPTEAVVMRMYGRLTLHAESVVLPLLAPDSPVVTWWHGPPPEQIATDPLGVLGGRRITDCSRAPDPFASLEQRAADYVSGDTDLAWTRTTSWRSLLASGLDSLDLVAHEARVTGEHHNPSRGLLAGWLSARLGVEADCVSDDGPGITSASISGTSGDRLLSVALRRPSGGMATLSRTDEADCLLPLPRRRLGDLLTEELRRLDPDPVYAEALAAATGRPLNESATGGRVHVWRDPVAVDS